MGWRGSIMGWDRMGNEGVNRVNGINGVNEGVNEGDMGSMGVNEGDMGSMGGQ